MDDITHSDWCPDGNPTDDETGLCAACEAWIQAEGARWLAYFGGREVIRQRAADERFYAEHAHELDDHGKVR